MKRFKLKKYLTLVLVAMMLITSLPVNMFAADYNYDQKAITSVQDLNKKPLTVAQAMGKPAEEIIKNPAMPKLYTMRADYKVPRNDEEDIAYQPYIATVGDDEYTYTDLDGKDGQKVLTEAEKDKIKKTINLPDIDGYTSPTPSFTVNYDYIKKNANKGNLDGDEKKGEHPYIYKPKQGTIRIKHSFQKLENLEEYGYRDGDNDFIYTSQTGVTGTSVTIKALDGDKIKGYVPEVNVLSTQVPQNSNDFEIEMRYNRAIFDVNFDSDGGTELPGMTLIYGQTIPKLNFDIEKLGSNLQGWKANKDITYIDQAGTKQTLSKDTLIKKEDFEVGGKFQDGIKNAMPAETLTFTAEWTDKPKADYVIQFWTEKPDYNDKDDSLDLRDRYDFIGSRRVDNVDTGSTPNLTNLDIHGITFPDLNGGRLEKAQNNKEEFARYYFLNEGLTKKQNASEDNPNVQKSVLSTGETVYNVYYDRRVYTLYFTSINIYNDPWAYWPIITKDGKVLGKEGSPYKVNVRFNQSLDKIWPKDEEVSGLPKGYTSDPTGDDGLIGWMINHNNNDNGVQIFRDTPPYRLSAEDFIDAEDVMGTDVDHGKGHADEIPIADGKTKKRDKYEISLGASYYDAATIHHIDIIKDDFDGKEQIDYDMSYWKSDTNTYDYEFILPHLQGFTLKKETRPAQLIGKIKVGDVEKTFDELNAERNKKTPFRSDDDKIEYISHFPWSQKLFDGTNAYDYANYYRNKYKLKLNNDPKAIKNDNEYTDGKDRFDVFYEMPLKNLQLDTNNVPKKPDWVPNNWEFKGWATDPAGENLLKDGKETKLHYDQFLFAKWGEPDAKWKVTIDPDGGTMKNITVEDLIFRRSEDHNVNKSAVKEANDGNKQIFTVNHKEKLNKVQKPKRKGYDFLGWQVIRYNKYGTVDTSYRKTYGVPELYAFGNEVVGNVYIKAIWLANNKIDVPVYHHFIDKDGNEIIKPRKFVIEDARAKYYTAATATEQNQDWILMPHEELMALPDENKVKQDYIKYNEHHKFDNTDIHSLKVEPQFILGEDGNSKPNPKAEFNEFHFYYRRFKTRDYKVNYLDKKAQAEIKKIIEGTDTVDAKKAAIANIVKDNSIIPQEEVVSRNRHYDARNYRRIPGWKLASDPQQQLFYNVEEDTGEFKGINGTGLDEIFFYYEDVRVIDVPENDPVPDGYVRVTYKVKDGGSFTDKNGNPVKEINYDVIKGLKSDLLVTPQELQEGEAKEDGKYYITPDAGKKFIKWDEKPLLNDNTIIDKNYTFTAFFDWSDVKVDTLVVTESFKDGNWINNFIPTEDVLKEQVKKLDKNGKEVAFPTGTEITIKDSADEIYEKLRELDKDDSTELVREVKIKAEIKFSDNSKQEIEIPVKVYKNVYEALTSGVMPKVLKDATEADGDLINVTGNYVKVTVNPTGKPGEKDSKIYYVNKNAWVEIPEITLTEAEKKELGFTHWSADKDAQNENGAYDFNKRHKFTEDTVISPGFSKDVVPQTGDDKPKVPDNFVKVIVKTTDKATTELTQTFWVNPTKEVTIPVDNPIGKNVDKTATEEAKAYTFTDWKSDENPERTWTSAIKGQFKNDTIITAQYDDVKNIIPYDPSNFDDPNIVRPDGYVRVKFEADDGLTLSNVNYYYVKANAGIILEKLAKPTVTEKIGYKFDKWDKDDAFEITNADITVKALSTKLDNVIPETKEDGTPNDKPQGYKEVVFVADANGKLEGVTKFFVNPDEYVTINPPKAVGNTGYEFGSWDKNATIPTEYKEDVTTITASFNELKDVIPKTNPDGTENKQPDGYKKVTFVIDPATGGQIADKEVTVYYVNPAKEVTVPQPKTAADTGYEFEKWDQDTVTTAKKYTTDTTVKGSFKKLDDIIPETNEDGENNPKPEGYVTVTFDKGEHGKDIAGQTVYYVNPKADPAKTLGDPTIVKPEVKAETGYNFTGWDTKDDFEIRDNKTVIAQYTPIDDVIPKLDDKGNENKQPEGYITVTFEKGANGELEGNTVFYINPNKAVALEDKAPTIKPNIGLTSAGWDTSINKEIKYSDGDKITAKYNPIGNIIPGDQQKPAGYVEVEFNKGEHGELSGTQTYWVKPGVQVTVPEPSVDSAVGYKFKQWDKSTTLTAKSTDTKIEITAQYDPLENIIPGDQAQPKGYIKVTFKSDANGSLSGTTVYYVNPNVEVDLTSQANGITKNPKLGYTENNGSWNPTIASKQYNEDAEYIFNFIKLDDVIPAGDGVDQPKDYVKVEFIADSNGSLKGGNKTYYVNPEKNVTVGSTELPIPETEPADNYKFDKWYEAIDETETIKNDKKFVARFKLNKVTMTYKADDATTGTVPAELSYDIGTEIVLAGGNDLKKDNYVLTGWKIGETTYNPGAKYKIEKNTTATAVWEEGLHTVEFDTDGGSYIATQKVKHNELITEVNSPTKDGFTFIGWKLDNNKFDTTTDKVTKDITLVAQYVPNVIEQTGDNKPEDTPDEFVEVIVKTTENGIEKATDATKFEKTFWVAKDKVVTIPVTNPTGKKVDKTQDSPDIQYVFKEWKSDEAIERTWADSISGQFTANVTTITAQYEENIAKPGIVNTGMYYTSESLIGFNNYLPSEDELKSLVKSQVEGDIEEVTILSDDFDTEVYDKLKENEKLDREEISRTEIINAKITFANGSTKDIEIPIVVYKNIYEGLTNGGKPDYVTRAEKDLAKSNPDREDTEYVRVTLIPTFKAKNQQRKTYYVRKNASVIIPEIIAEGRDAYEFIYWKAEKPGEGQDNPNYGWATRSMSMFRLAATAAKDDLVDNNERVDFNDRMSFDQDTDIVAQYETKQQPTPEDPSRPDPSRPDPWTPGHSGGNIYIGGITEKIVEVPAKMDPLHKEVRYMQGFNGYFRPNDGLTRAEAAQILANALVEDGYNYNPNYKISYPDIGNEWYTRAIKITTEANVFAGYDDGLFRPEKKITRAEWVATLRRFQNIAEADGNHMNLSANHWAKGEIEGAYNEGWLKIYTDGLAKFNADEFIPRQEVAAVSNRAFNRVFDKTYIDRNDKALINQYKDVKPSMWAYEDILCASNTFVHDEILYRAHDVKNDKVTFNVNLNGLEIIQDKFQRILR